MDRGAAVLVARMKQAAGRTVTYARKSGGATVSLTAWVGNTLYARQTDEPGASVVYGERDYFVAAADLVQGGTAFLPQRGDQVTETIDGAAVTFELSTPTGEPVWRYSDQTRQVLRLHCKRAS